MFYVPNVSSLQEECVMKILRCMDNEVVFGNPDLKFSHETGGKLHTSGATPEGYFTIPVSDRQQLTEVSNSPVSRLTVTRPPSRYWNCHSCSRRTGLSWSSWARASISHGEHRLC